MKFLYGLDNHVVALTACPASYVPPLTRTLTHTHSHTPAASPKLSWTGITYANTDALQRRLEASMAALFLQLDVLRRAVLVTDRMIERSLYTQAHAHASSSAVSGATSQPALYGQPHGTGVIDTDAGGPPSALDAIVPQLKVSRLNELVPVYTFVFMVWRLCSVTMEVASTSASVTSITKVPCRRSGDVARVCVALSSQ